MKKVYIITTGSYSDYSIRGVYSTRKKAEASLVLFENNYEYPRVEEHILDAVAPIPKGYNAYHVFMDVDGNTKSTHEVEFENLGEFENGATEGFGYKRVGSTSVREGVRFNVVGRDLKHAIKIANEKRVQLIADNSWNRLVANAY